jgi:polyhydroxybutyrate depolymerase
MLQRSTRSGRCKADVGSNDPGAMRGISRTLHAAGQFLAALVVFSASAAAQDRMVLRLQEIDRTVQVRRPAGTWPAPQPLVLALHGRGGDGAAMRQTLDLDAVADREGFIVAYPDGVDRHWSYGRPINLPMPTVNGTRTEDIAFLTQIIDRLVGDGSADPRRLYVVGHSNGGLMAFTMACALADRLAAVAVLLTGMTEHQVADCPPGRPVPMLILGATADPLQAYDGAVLPRGRLISVPDTVAFWRTRNECRDSNLERLPDREPADGSTVATIHSRDCRDGAEVLLVRIEGGGHLPPSIRHDRSRHAARLGPQNRDIETAEIVWSFLKRFRR